jgi:hypothetical protein
MTAWPWNWHRQRVDFMSKPSASGRYMKARPWVCVQDADRRFTTRSHSTKYCFRTYILKYCRYLFKHLMLLHLCDPISFPRVCAESSKEKSHRHRPLPAQRPVHKTRHHPYSHIWASNASGMVDCGCYDLHTCLERQSHKLWLLFFGRLGQRDVAGCGQKFVEQERKTHFGEEEKKVMK